MRKSTFIGVAMEPPSEGDLPSVAVIHPGHPEGDARPGMYFGNVLNGKPLLVVPEAKFVVDVQVAHFDSNDFDAPAGAMFLIEDQLHLAILTGHSGTRTVNLETGGFSKVHDLHRYVWFSGWQLHSPDINGKWIPICEYKLPDKRIS